LEHHLAGRIGLMKAAVLGALPLPMVVVSPADKLIPIVSAGSREQYFDNS